jgi:hypothetical protein
VALIDDLERIASAALRHRDGASAVSAVLAAEATPGLRRYLCAFQDAEDRRTWIVLDDDGSPVTVRPDVRDAVAIAALCELAEESAGGGDLDELLSQLVALRLTDAPSGIDEAEEAVRELQTVIGSPPQLASPSRLDAIGAATRKLEQALDPTVPSPFTAALQSAPGAVEELTREVEAAYLAVLV